MKKKERVEISSEYPQGLQTRIVVGLGNPGAKYQGSRHNVGFEVLDEIAGSHRAPMPKAKFDGQWTSITHNDTNLIMVWPLTFMNDSGRCVKAISSFYKANVQQDLLVVCDDLSLPVGKLRLRAKGSAGGQKGLQDILRVLGSQEVPRLRIGIDATPAQWETANYVLGRFRKDERPIIDVAIKQAAEAVLAWCSHGLAHCMNRFN